jgi:hypothetical protein
VPAGRSTNATATQPELALERLCGPAGTDREWLNRGLPWPKVGLPSRLVLSALEKGHHMPVMIGVDPHKASPTAAALDQHGQLLDRQPIPATLDGYQTLRAWAARWPDRRWAVEGAHGIGRALAQRLVGDGEQVLDVPAKLAARVRVLSVGHGRKSDGDDAVSVAVAAATLSGCARSAWRTRRWCCTC